MGFEPTTASLEGWNSTTELRPPYSKISANNSSKTEYLFSICGLPKYACTKSLSENPYLTATNWLTSQSSKSEGWWAGKDSNLGSRWQQIYSLPPLSTWVPAHFTLTHLGSLPLSHQRLRESFMGKGGIRYRQNPPPSCISNRLELGLHKNFTFRNRPRVDPNKPRIIGSS